MRGGGVGGGTGHLASTGPALQIHCRQGPKLASTGPCLPACLLGRLSGTPADESFPWSVVASGGPVRRAWPWAWLTSPLCLASLLCGAKPIDVHLRRFCLLVCTGYFLGGHYSLYASVRCGDAFVQCCCWECKQLPEQLQDEKAGVKGCIWTATQWEGHCGCAGRKKWRHR